MPLPLGKAQQILTIAFIPVEIGILTLFQLITLGCIVNKILNFIIERTISQNFAVFSSVIHDGGNRVSVFSNTLPEPTTVNCF